MINILYEQFPRSISADGAEYEIVTDFRDWIQFSDMIADDTLPKEIKIGFMGQWLIDPPKYMTAEIVDALSRFYEASELEYVRRSSKEAEVNEICRPPVFDWRTHNTTDAEPSVTAFSSDHIKYHLYYSAEYRPDRLKKLVNEGTILSYLTELDRFVA